MQPTKRANDFRLVALIVDIASHIIWTYIREKYFLQLGFESILKIKKEKHKLHHFYETSGCCECLSDIIKGEKIISRKQLYLLYTYDKYRTCN